MRKTSVFQVCLLTLLASVIAAAQEEHPKQAPTTAIEEAEKPGVLNWKTREIVFLKKLVGVDAIWGTLPGAAIDEIRNFPQEWGRTGAGLGKRVASQYGKFAVGEAIETTVQAIHHEDPRYFRLGSGGFFHRLKYSLLATFWVPKQGGGHTFAYSVPAGAYGSWAVATRWYPESEQSGWKVLKFGTSTMGTGVAANSFREFWPDIKRRVFHKK